MDLYYALIIYILIFIILLIIFCVAGLNFWGALVLTIIICQLILWILKSPFNVQMTEESGSAYFIYILINILSPIIVYLYVIVVIIQGKT